MYQNLGQLEEALRLRRDVYSGSLRLHGEEHSDTLQAALNYASTLHNLQHFEEAKALMRNTIPVAQRVFGESHELTLKMRWIYAEAHYKDSDATLADLREAVNTLEDSARGARRVYGGQHPIVAGFEYHIKHSRAALAARETPGSP